MEEPYTSPRELQREIDHPSKTSMKMLRSFFLVSSFLILALTSHGENQITDVGGIGGIGAGSNNKSTDKFVSIGQNSSVENHDSTFYAQAQTSSGLSVMGELLTFNANGNVQVGSAAGIYASGYVITNISFKTSSPTYYSFGGSITDGAYVFGENYLSNRDTGEVIYGFGNDTGIQPARANGQAQGVLAPGNYQLSNQLFIKIIDSPSSTSVEGNSNVYFYLTPTPVPQVVTGKATSFAPSSATLTGTVNANGQTTTAWFQYGKTTAYGQFAAVSLQPNNSTSVQSVMVTVSGLDQAIYHCRLVAKSASGTAFGQDVEFAPQNAYNTAQFASTNYNVDRRFPYASIAVSIVQNDPFSGCTVNYTTQDQTAIAGTNYKQTSGMLQWQPGDTRDKTIIIPMIPSANITGNKAFLATLSAPVASTIGTPAQTTVTINENNGPSAPQPAIGSVNPTPARIHLEGVGSPNSSYQILSSPDLSANNFAPLTTITADAGGSFFYDDANVTNRKFYRLIYPPPTSGIPNSECGDKTLLIEHGK